MPATILPFRKPRTAKATRPALTGASLIAIAVVSLLPSYPTVASQEGTARDATGIALDEITVEGRRTLRTLHAQMIELEDEFYTRFNALNSSDLFDVHCGERARTGTLIRRRYCRAVYESRAMETEGQQHLAALHYQKSEGSNEPKEWIPPTPAIVAIERRRKDFRQEMIDVTRRHPELTELLRQRQALEHQYHRLQRQIFDGS